MSLPEIPGFTLSGRTYTLNYNYGYGLWTPIDFGIVTEDIIIDGNGYNFSRDAPNINEFDCLFIGGGQVTVNNSDQVISENFIQIKNFNLEIRGNTPCGLIKATGSIKISNCTLTIKGDILDNGGGFVSVTDNTTSPFKSIIVEKSFVHVQGNIGSNSGPIVGFIANGNNLNIDKSVSVVLGNISSNAGAFIGAYGGINKSTTISNSYCFLSGQMAEFSGVLAGSYFASNGIANISNVVLITNITNDINIIDQPNRPCYISSHRTNTQSITATNCVVWDISNKSLKANDSQQELAIEIYLNLEKSTNFELWASTNLSNENFNLIDKFSFKYFDESNFISIELPKINNYNFNYSWLLNNNKLINLQDTFVLLFEIPQGSTTINLPVNRSISNYTNATINWGDNSSLNNNVSGPITHTFELTTSKLILISITGHISKFGLYNQTNWFDYKWAGIEYLLQVISFGNIGLQDLSYAFFQAPKLSTVPKYLPQTVNNFEFTFYGCEIFNDSNIISWNVSNVNRMTGMFFSCQNFNQDISIWDVSKVQDMSDMFSESATFNQDLSLWFTKIASTNNIVFVNRMFQRAKNFNKNVGTWNFTKIGNATDMISYCGYTYLEYGEFIKSLANNNTLPILLSFGFTGFIRLDDVDVTNAYNLLTSSFHFGGKDVMLFDGGSYSQAEIINYSSNIEPVGFKLYKINSKTSNTEININSNTIITDSGGFLQPYDYNENFEVTFNIDATKKYTLTGNINLDSSKLNFFPSVNNKDYLIITDETNNTIFNSDQSNTSFSSLINIPIENKSQLKFKLVSDFYYSGNGFYLLLKDINSTPITPELSNFIIPEQKPNTFPTIYNPNLPNIINNISNNTIEYTSNDNTIADIDINTGNLTLKQYGTVFITATISNTTIKQVAILKITNPNISTPQDDFLAITNFLKSTTVGTTVETATQSIASVNLANNLLSAPIVASVFANNSGNSVNATIVSSISVNINNGTVIAIASIDTNTDPNANTELSNTIQALGPSNNINVLSILEIKSSTPTLNFIVSNIDPNKKYYASHFNENGQIDRTVEGTIIDNQVIYSLTGFSIWSMFNSTQSITNTTIVQTGGDPIIVPVKGPKYALASHIKFVNLFADYGNKIFINAHVELLNKNDFPNKIYWENEFVNLNDVHHIYSNSYYRRFFIYYLGECVEIDADTLFCNSLTKLNKIKIVNFEPKTGIKSISFNKVYPLTNKTKNIKIGFNNFILTIMSDVNTDDRHYIEFIDVKSFNQTNLSGAFINPNKIINISNLVGPELFNYQTNPFN